MVLIFFTVLALVCANVPALKEWYFALWQNPVQLSIGSFNFFSHNGHTMTVMHVINDFLMAIFFFSVGLEIKREILIGELSSREKAMLPIIGACGGMLVPVLVFLLVCPSDAAMQRGVAIPMATDESPTANCRMNTMDANPHLMARKGNQLYLRSSRTILPRTRPFSLPFVQRRA